MFWLEKNPSTWSFRGSLLPCRALPSARISAFPSVFSASSWQTGYEDMKDHIENFYDKLEFTNMVLPRYTGHNSVVCKGGWEKFSLWQGGKGNGFVEHIVCQTHCTNPVEEFTFPLLCFSYAEAI
jgi:hypothetical protein